MAKLLRTDGTRETVFPKNGKAFSLEELQSYVNGDIECVRCLNGRIFVMNEEGKLRGLDINRNATALYRYYIGVPDVLVGDVLLCWPDEII